MPVSSTGLLRSYSAENEWCANAREAANNSARTRKSPSGRYLIERVPRGVEAAGAASGMIT